MLQVILESNYPSAICEECITNINNFFNFRKVVINNDADIRDRVEAIKNSTCNNSDVLEPVETEEEQITIEIAPEVPNNEQQASSEENSKKSDSTPSEISKTICNNNKRNSNKKLRTRNETRRKRYQCLSKNRGYYCSKCNFYSDDKTAIKKHKTSAHVALGICNICGKSMRSDNLGKHIRNHYGNHICPECGKKCNHYEALRAHLYEHKGTKLPCEICGKTFFYHGDLNRHVKKHCKLNVTFITIIHGVSIWCLINYAVIQLSGIGP